MKIVLSFLAAVLFAPIAQAQVVGGGSCGSSAVPCFVQISSGSATIGTVNQGAAASSGPWIETPWIAGAVNSATNGLYYNVLQGNAVLSATNPLPTQRVATAVGGATPYHLLSAATNNATNVKATGGTLYSLSLINTTATLYYLRLYDSATSAPTCSSATGVVANIPIPASTTGAGVVMNFDGVGMAFANGIGFCLTGAFADNDNTNAATGVAVNLTYK